MNHSDIEHMAQGYPPSHIGKDCEEVITWLATQLLATQEQRDAMAAENLALKGYIDDECYIANPTGMDYIGAYASSVETPATVAYLNAVRADGADKVAEYHFVRIDALKEVSRQGHLFHKAAYSDAVNVARLFRAGKE
ncbi:hypothetical protein [Pantoea agglomerans]|uniref:hypothetical protein n=1 Tax=Enterobacter agglomerans TaxID=549 RepID=UPI001780D989|nr:hypothetical protein [Pantoea agglomerans]MBD8132017.1 hypothetical protein [Pantoea agglomerans]